MLKGQLNKTSLLIILALAILAASIHPVLVFATGQDVLINLEDIEENFNKEGIRFNVWFISGEKLSEKDSLATRDELNKLDNATLNAKFPNHFTSDPTGQDGKVWLKSLKDGAYFVRQTVDGTESSEKMVVSFILNLPNKENEIKPKVTTSRELKLKKVDEEGQPLSGAAFEIYRILGNEKIKIGFTNHKYDSGSKNSVIIIDSIDGTLSLTNLPEGNYVIKEVKAPEGFELSGQEIPFVIKNGEMTELVILNKKIKGTNDGGEHRFLKFDGETNQPLKSAVFKVAKYNEQDDTYVDVIKDGKLYTLESNEQGEFKVEGLAPGEYYLFELRSPEGYELDSEPIDFVIDENSHLERLDIPNLKALDVPEKPQTGRPPLIEDDEIVTPPKRPLTPKTPQANRTPPSGGTTSNGRPSGGRGVIPKTGDISLMISAIGGVILAGIGLNLIKREDD